MTSRGRESTKLCGNFAFYITSIIVMLITILLMVEDRCSINFAKNACYVHISFIICDENGYKTNLFLYFNFGATEMKLQAYAPIILGHDGPCLPRLQPGHDCFSSGSRGFSVRKLLRTIFQFCVLLSVMHFLLQYTLFRYHCIINNWN